MVTALAFFGRYTINSQAHKSATCTVFLATDTEEDNRPVALKVMHQPDQFMKEVELRLQCNLKRQYVVKALRVHLDPDAKGATEICKRLERPSLESAGQIEVHSDAPFSEAKLNVKGDPYR
eukprot:scaffold90082_cov32-Prasinocladus_malaysianus.AAC.2